VGTVSNVLSSAPRVRESTRSRVQAVIEELGFRPNRVARSLIHARTMSVGIIVPDIANPFFAELVRGAEGPLDEAGFVAFVGSSDNEVERELRYLESFSDRQIDGLIVAVTAGAGSPVSRLASQLAAVAVDRVTADWLGDAVVGDGMAGMRLAVDHLLGLGHVSIGFINGDAALSTGRERSEGFTSALERRGLKPSPMLDGTFTFASGIEQGRHLLERDDRPTAICAANDLVALGAIAAANELGIDVPRDLSVVGFDDIILARVTSPGLTTVHQPALEMGRAAAGLLIGRMSGDEIAPRHLVLPPSLVIRGSTAPVVRST